MATSQAPRAVVALTAGALAALVANVLIPDSPIRPTRLLRKLLRFVAVLKGPRERQIEMLDHQRELLKGNESLFTTREIALLQMLMEEGQGHIIAFWAELGTDDGKKCALANQLSNINSSYPGGLQAYVRNGRALISAACRGENPLSGYVPEHPAGVTLTLSSQEGWEQFEAYELTGLEAIRSTAFVLVAGGLGERLGYNGIKVSLPVDLAGNKCYLEHYIHNILALQQRSGAKKPLPLAIMTSDDTHDSTQQLLQSNNFFGASPQQIHCIKQGRVPCFINPAGHLALDSHDPYKLQVKPHGHGDVHVLLYNSGLAKKWQASGTKWIAFFQDTNAMVFRGLLPTIGVSVSKAWDMNFLCVPRKAKEAIGAVCTLRSNDGQRMTVNVEYNQLDPLLCSTIQPAGDVNDSTGFSPFPGNINQLVIKMDTYMKQLTQTQGVIAEFVNPKFKDASRSAFKKPTRLECMMQDFAKSLPTTAQVGFTTVSEVWATYMPCKNSPEEALAKAAAGNPTHSATHAEWGMYSAWCRLLSQQGAAIELGGDAKFCGLPVQLCSQLSFSPSFVSSLSQLKNRFPQPKQVSISARSSLVVTGDVTFEHLHLDGALVVKVEPGASLRIQSLVVKNQGWSTEAVDTASEEPQKLQIRGFKISKSSGCLLEVTAGNVVVDGIEDQPVTITYSATDSPPIRFQWVAPEA